MDLTTNETTEAKPATPSRILLVEDDAMVRKMLARFLEPRYAIAHAGNGREALELLKQEQEIDLILTDVRMPIMDGLQLVRAVKRVRPHVPIVVMTGLGTEETAIEALRAGATNYLKKPFRNNELDLVVRKSLELGQARRGRLAGLTYLRESTKTFEFPARVDIARSVIALLTEGLVEIGLIEATDLLNLEVALGEALSNAVLHGALEMTEAVEATRYDREAFDRAYQERVREPKYGGRSVGVQARLSQDAATFVVEDPGKGFDFSALPPAEQLSTLEGLRGRGLMLIRLFMDDVAHEVGGRRIRMVKKASRGGVTSHVARPQTERITAASVQKDSNAPPKRAAGSDPEQA